MMHVVFSFIKQLTNRCKITDISLFCDFIQIHRERKVSLINANSNFLYINRKERQNKPDQNNKAKVCVIVFSIV